MLLVSRVVKSLNCRSKRLLAAGIHKKVCIYEIANPSAPPVSIRLLFRFDTAEIGRLAHVYQLQFDGHTGNVTAVCFHSEGKWLVTGSEDGTIKIWDLR